MVGITRRKVFFFEGAAHLDTLEGVKSSGQHPVENKIPFSTCQLFFSLIYNLVNALQTIRRWLQLFKVRCRCNYCLFIGPYFRLGTSESFLFRLMDSQPLETIV